MTGMEGSIATRERTPAPSPEVRIEAISDFDAPDRFDLFVIWVGTSVRSIWDQLTWVGMVASVLVGVLALELGGSSERASGVIMASATAGIAFAVAWQATGRVRVGWAAVSLGSVLWCGGSQARPLWESAGRSTIRMGIADVAAAGAMLAFAVALLALLDKPQRPVARLRFAAEGLMIAASVLFACWVTILPAAFTASSGRALGDQIQMLAFPLGDVLLLGVVVFAVTKLPHLARGSLLLLPGIGALAMLSTATSEAGPAADRPGVAALAIALAFLAIATAGVRTWQAGDDPAPAVVDRPRLLLLAAPGLSILIVVGTTLRQVTGQPVAVELGWITIGVLTLAVLLHVTVIAENQLLANELSLARDEAIHASTLKSHFLANVSHEIRTPMNAVIGLTGLLLDTELDDDQHELAVGVATSAEGLLGLIDSLLDFSKIEAERMELEEIDLDLTDLLDEVAMLVGDSARRKGIELFAYCEPGMITHRRGDPVRLRQILLNLVNNAVKFTSEGSVTLRAMPVEGQPDHVAFLVIDTGIGIPEAEQARLFEPFSQLDETTTRNYGGTGLGLGIVRGLVDLQGGSIELASEVGEGTVFRVTLPMDVGTQSTERGLAALVGLRALVVDGNAVNRSVLAHTLHSWGFVVDQATSAEEALHEFAWTGSPNERYAVAIIEHKLDGMDGMELARILRHQEPTSSTVVLLLSSSVDLSRQEAHDAGIESVLIRPVRTTYLLRRIVDALIARPAPEPERVSQP
ncbi:ATP-binding protein [Aquihabitans daechungensis]|uniref:hybrid sensor histidine kinase/response regulator n=1 Tax=Aquihabitans daechungensis TaxID=1052257 RepID=UPI003BA2D5F3